MAEFYLDNGPQTFRGDPDAGWDNGARYAAPGVDVQSLDESADWFHGVKNARSLIVLRGGRIAYERYFHGSGPQQSNNVHSASKSILQAVYGIAVGRGDLPGYDIPIGHYLPAAVAAGGAKAAITIRQLLLMRSGLQWSEDETEYAIENEENWIEAILGQPLAATPGSRFHYSTGDTHLLSAVLQAATGATLEQYASAHLFTPLGISHQGWGCDPQGIASGGCNLFLPARALARFGELYLRNGVWNGRQLVPAEAVAFSRTYSGHKESDPRYQYGALWWLATVQGHPVQFAWGWGGQYVAVVPSLDLVFSSTQDTTGKPKKVEARELDLLAFLDEDILPAVT
ncbi:serine hydrolase [Pilimelia terevasa]|uniref:Serine hydrolase n=1 Tax=Pilimelia terevasa TaxID=53372 RepID=A0A8J3FJ88_9ACTN|nr:serine hydrolase [Pilimelia terevasa]GGK22542.1 serine hydrolase [Pilimelia terevasa]